ncbi:MAG: T9SS type A sorting domain-containing protein [Sphingobacteriales bacterium]|nr:MAG: T9SS type A sorting domain-containing protein [Sphingobacteriales bacterium]
MKTTIYTMLCAMIVASSGSDAAAQTWRPKHAGLADGLMAASVYGEDSRIIVANGSPSNGASVYYTPDSATHYTGTNMPASFSYLMTEIVKCHGTLFVGGSAGVFKSADNGVTWTATGGTSHTWALYSHNDTLYANMGATSQEPYFSADDGATWGIIPNHPGDVITDFVKYNGVLYAGGASSLAYTSDHGATWTSVPSLGTGLGNSYALVSFQGKVYTASAAGVFETADNGITWTNKTLIAPRCMIAVDTSLLIGTGLSGVYRSDKSAGSWTQVSGGLPLFMPNVYDAITALSSNDEFIIAGALGSDSTIYIIGLPELGLTPDTTTTPTSASEVINTNISFSLVPNPASDEISIRLTKSAGEVLVTLFDMTGKRIMSYSKRNTDSFRVDLRDLSQGVYLIELVTNGARSFKKFEVKK